MRAKLWWSRHWVAWGRIALLVIGAILVQLGVSASVRIAHTDAHAPQAQLGHAVPVTAVQEKAPKPAKKPKAYEATATHWPAATTGTLVLGPRKSRSAGNPVWAQAVATGGTAYEGPSSLAVKVLSRKAAQRAGVNGVLAQITPAGAGHGTARVGVDYSSFAQSYGGDYASRLHLVRMPACAVTTPQVPACRKQTPLKTANDVAGHSVSATMALAAATDGLDGTAAVHGTAMVIAAVSSTASGDGGGSGGQYGATSLKASGSWSSGGSSGSFEYSYPIAVPPSVTALEPTPDLSYDSGSIDGQTASAQAQSSWIGDGWSTADSFIEQSFVSCANALEGTQFPSEDLTGDMCYDGPLLTLSLNGASTSMVWDSTNSTWKPANGNGDVIHHHTGTNNGSGTYNTDYWTVTDPSGNVFEFGRNELPGWSSGQPTTHSVDYEPVFSPNSGDPCYSSSGFADSVCTMAYRWHLDYVTNLHGGAMAYYYQQATNHYAERNGAADGIYVRDSYLDHIDYGFTDGNAYGTVPDKVVYTPGDRCVSGTCDPLSSSTSANWPDVPFDLICSSGTGCSDFGPAFFSTVRLSSIATEQWNGSAYNTVDSWSLDTTIPTTGTFNTSTLWLNSITHTGEDTTAGGTAVTLPKVSFSPTMMANRVNFTSGIGGGLGPLNRYRIGSITTETGSVISVTYELVDPCTPTSIQTLDPSSNTTSCFPVMWTPDETSTPYLDWFNKYVVKSVAQSDPSGGSEGLYTEYGYPGPAAWHYDDNELVRAKYRTYGQWRGYGDVQTRTGQGVDPATLSETWFYRGMDGDWLSSSSTRSVTLTDSQGGRHPDTDQLAGKVLESATYTYDGGPVDHSTINSYWVSAPFASRTRSGLPPLTANIMGQVETWDRQAITSTTPTTWRTTETDVSYDTDPSSATFGQELFSYDHGDLALAGTSSSQETCTQTTYAPANTALNLVGLVAETETDDKPCGGSSPGGATVPTAAQTNALTAPASLDKTTDVISDTRTFYDQPTLAGTWPQPSTLTWPQAAPTLGDDSVEQDATGYSNGAFTYQTKTATVYDTYGRPVTTYDGDGNQVTTAYTDTSYLTTTAVEATNALGQSTTTTLDPERAVTLSSTDVNNVTTTVHSDGLGRTIAVWKDSRSTGTSANQLYSYVFPAAGTTAPVVVTTEVMNDEGGYSTSTTLLDALLRTRQTQDQAVTTTAGRIVSDTFYDSHGWVHKTNTDYWDNQSNPNGTLVQVADNKADQQTLTSYDGLGRATVVTSLDDSTVKQTAYSQYLGDRTVTVPPQGAVATATLTDALGRTTELDQYSTDPTVTTHTDGGFTTAAITGGTTQATHYTFNAQGRAYQTVDAAGDAWSTRYDFQGNAIGTTDPDAGSTPQDSPTLYDAVGNVLQSTDPAGHTQSFVYDKLNRKTAQYDADLGSQSSGNEVASWAYDNSNNAVAGMTYPIGHLTTETSYTPDGAFTMQAKGFNLFGESLGEIYTVPGSSALAGSYTYQHSYTTTVGRPKATLVPAAGGMAQEILTTGYCGYSGLDQACTLGGAHGYVQNVAYNAQGQVAQEVVGSATAKATVTNTYDLHTGDLTDQNVINTAVSGTPLDETKYGYDPSGNITSQTDIRSGTTTETQCYGYDALDRLSQAWTTASSAATTCDTSPTPENAATVVGDGVTGSAYWTSWSFDSLGQPHQQVQHSLTGGGDSTTTYTYGGSASGCATSTGAHTLATAATTTGGSTSTNTYCYNQLGATTSRTTTAGQQSLTWDDEGRLHTATTGANTTTYDYDTDGNVIQRTDPDSVTVFLPDQQITLNTTTSTLANTRFYALPGGGQAVVTNQGYGFSLADQHGTATLALDSTAKNPTWQQYTPYGAPRGSAPGSTWLDPNGFLDKPQDSSDELTTVGAREYDSTLGRFINLDPVLESDPQQLNGYTYASSNPVTFSDPTGLDNWWADPTQNVPTVKGAPPITEHQAAEEGFAQLCTATTCSGYSKSQTQAARAAANRAHAAYEAAVAAAQKKAEAAARAKAKAEEEAAKRHCAWYNVGCQISAHAQAILQISLAVLAVAAIVAVCVLAPEVALAAGMAFAESAATTGSLAMASIAGTAAGLSTAASAAGMTTVAVATAVVANVAGADGFAAGGRGGGGAPHGAGGSGSEACSFAPDTPVLMNDGKTKPIGKIKTGDKVEAADPGTGKEEGGRAVQHVWINHDNDLLDVTVTTSPGHKTTIHTTSNHPFWDDTTHTWVPAGKLPPGHHLASTKGHHPVVQSIKPTPGAANRWNLTVTQLHTYYVLAGVTPVLVHNCNGNLADLPIHERPTRFYARASEMLDRVPGNPATHEQMYGSADAGHGGVTSLSNDDLIRFGGPNGREPITGFRDFAPGDDINLPGSRLHIADGNNRTEEIRNRVLDGRMHPDTLIEMMIGRS